MWINLLCDYVYRRSCRRRHLRRHPAVHQGRRPRDPESRLLRARGRDDPTRRQAQPRGIPRPDRDRRLAQTVRSNGTAKAYAYGRYVGLRYRRYPNIVWLSGNDFQTWSDPADDALVLAVAKGIRSADPDALQTVELNYLTSTSLDDSRWRGTRRARRRVHLFPDLRGGPEGVPQPRPRPGVHDRGQLRGRALVHRPRDAAAPGVLDSAERSDGPVLRQ